MIMIIIIITTIIMTMMMIILKIFFNLIQKQGKAVDGFNLDTNFAAKEEIENLVKFLFVTEETIDQNPI